MKKILVPIDFSNDAEHALQYALELNKKLKGKILLYHSYVLPVYATDIPLAVPDYAEMEKVAMDGLTSLQAKYRKEYPGTPIETYVSEGFAEDAITKAAEKTNADLIVMGTKGASGLREALIGTVTATIIEHAACPVIAVPPQAKWTDLDKIVYATAYEEGDFGNIEQVIAFARKMDAEVVLLHISSGKNDKAYEFDALERFRESIVQDSGFQKVTVKLIEDQNVFTCISNYIEEVNADMVAMNLRHRSFMQKLFERSLTKRMAYHTHVPLFAFHGDLK
jgi:nucleotide-binding universal stress UspA family protein